MTRRRPTTGWWAGDRTEEADRGKKIKRLAKSPCNRPPSAPTGLVGEFDRTEGGRGNRVAADLRWTEVTTDTSGLSSRVRSYRVELFASLTEEETDWFLVDRYIVPAKKDSDPGTKAHKRVRRLRGRLSYRFTVEAIDVGGCVSATAGPLLLGFPNEETPAGPSDVKIRDQGARSVVVRWEVPVDADDPDGRNMDPVVEDFGAEISLFNHFGVIYDRDAHVRGGRVVFRIDKEDVGLAFFGRVWSNSTEGVRSLPVPAFDPELHAGAGNDDPFADPDGVIVTTGERNVVRFGIPGNAKVKTYPLMFTADRDYKLRKVRATAGDHDAGTHPNDGCPQGSSLKLNLVHISADLSVRRNVFSSEERLVINNGTHKDSAAAADANVVDIPEDSHLVVKVTAIGSTVAGSDVAVYVALDPV